MVRSLRIEYEGAWYHVMNRGLEYRHIFYSNNHRKLFLKLLSDISWRFKVDVHGYCLMDNHYHLLIQTKLANLNLAMKYLNGVYTLKFNRDVKRDGPLFRGRYKAILINKDEYILNVSRYIHKNPSVAKITNDDRKYRWSSYRFYSLESEIKPNWLVTGDILKYFDDDEKKYSKFVDEEIDENTRKFYQSQNLKSIFGNKFFVKEISDKFLHNNKGIKVDPFTNSQLTSVSYPSLEEVAEKVSKIYKINLDLILRNNSRNSYFERSLLIYLFMLNPKYKSKEKGDFLGVGGDAILKSHKRFLKKINLDLKLKEEVENVRREIYGDI